MQIERLSVDDVARLGGPAGAAEHLRSRVPDGASVADEVREILVAVRVGGDAAVLDYTSRFDTAGNQPRPLLVDADELDEAITRLPLELIAGLQVAIANVALVADAGVREREDVAVELPQGQRVVLREVPVGSAAVYVPGGRAAYPSTVVMGVVTARSAGVIDVAVCAPPGADGQTRPAHPRHLPPVRRGARVPHGRRPGDRRARVRHSHGGARRRGGRPRQPVRAGGQAPALHERRHRWLRRTQRPADRPPRRRRHRRARAAARCARHARPGASTARAASSPPSRRPRRSATRSPRHSKKSSSNARRLAMPRVRSSRSPEHATRRCSRTHSRPSTCS